MYHISDLKKFIKCPRYYFLSCGNDINLNKFLRVDESVIELLAKYLHIDDCYVGVRGDDPKRFFEEKDNYEWFIKARFEAKDLRIKIPILHKDNDRYDVYFTHHGTVIKELDIFYYRLNIEVLQRLGIEIDDVYIAYINGNYVFKDELDVESLFIITDHYKGKRIIDLIEEEVDDYNEIINRINASNLNSYLPKKTRNCHSKNICPYYYDCFKEEKDLPDDSILTLVSSQYKDKMYKDGIKQLKDVDVDLLEGNRVQYAQIIASKNNGLFVDKYSLKEYLKKLDVRPISFIDFEWDTYLIPQYNGMKPLDVLPFEFVLYILDSNEQMKHYTFVGSGDCRKEFIEELLARIPKEGPIVAYNALGAETRRLEELATWFPEYSEQIHSIIKRFVDLADPFLEGIIYDVRMGGNFTLKKLVNIVSNLNYKDLDISDGMEAVYSWRDIDKGQIENQEETINNLIEYCSLDAYGLYLVYNWLKKFV